MTNSNGDCQTPSTSLLDEYVGNSGLPPKQYHESCFVADEAPGKLDVEHTILVSDPRVTVCIETTRYVGTVDPNGFLTDAQQHIDQGTLAEKMVLTIRARILTLEVGGTLGVDGLKGLLNVEVFLHKDTNHERKLGFLTGDYAAHPGIHQVPGGNAHWQEFALEVYVRDVKFPDDPCPTQGPLEPCSTGIRPAANEITFEFSGTALSNIIGNEEIGEVWMEVDWLMLEPKDEPGLAWRPVLLVHGWDSSSSWAWTPDSAWVAGLRTAKIAYHAIDLPPDGPIIDNGALITAAVDDMKGRFGVNRINVVAHSKGGVDTRVHVTGSTDVDTLMMIATPNAGTRTAYFGIARNNVTGSAKGVRDLTPNAMANYNRILICNPATKYVTAAGNYDSLLAKSLASILGRNDEVVPVNSVEALTYAANSTYETSTDDVESQGVCLAHGATRNHSCLLYHTRIFDDLFPMYIAVLTPSEATSGETGFRARDPLQAPRRAESLPRARA